MTLVRHALLAFALLATAPTLSACGVAAPAVVVENQELTVACGTCVFRLPDGQGCYWAVELDGAWYPMAGQLPKDHENHAPDGMCNMPRRARISGDLRGKNFIASRFDLLPAEAIPDAPKFTPEDAHGADYRVAP